MADALHELVRSLSKQEKRYFRLYATQHIKGGGNDYLRLFDVVSQMEDYDEGLIRKKLRREKFRDRLPFVKHYLHECLLDMLARYHQDKSVNSQLNILLNKIEALYVKSLFQSCKRLIARARKLAEQHDKFTRLLDLLDWEKQVHIATRYNDFKNSDLLRIRAQEEALAKRILGERESIFQGLQLSLIVQNEGFMPGRAHQKKMRDIMKQPLLKDDYRHPSFRSGLFALSTRSIYTLVTGQLEKSLALAYERIAFMERYPKKMKEEIMTYIQSINNLIITCEHITGRHREIEKAIQKLERLKETYPLQENAGLRLFLALTARKCGLYISSGRFGEADVLAQEIEEGFHRYGDSVSPHDRIIFSSFMGYMFFAKGDHTSATRWLNHIIQELPSDVREDVQSMSRIMFLLLNYDKGNDDYLFYLLQTTHRFLVQKKLLTRYESLILRTLKKLVTKKPGPKEVTEEFVTLRKMLEDLRDPHAQHMFAFFDIFSWLDSKISGRPFGEILAERLRAEQEAARQKEKSSPNKRVAGKKR